MCKKVFGTLILGVVLTVSGCGVTNQGQLITESEKQIEEDEVALSGYADSGELEPEEESYDEKIMDLVNEAELGQYYEIDTDYYINQVSECTFDYETGQTMGGEDWVQIFICDLGLRVWICDGIYEVETIEEAEEQSASADFINSMIEINGQQIFANDSRYTELLRYAINYNNAMSDTGATSVSYNESYRGIIAEYTLDGYTIWFYVYDSWAMVQISN